MDGSVGWDDFCVNTGKEHMKTLFVTIILAVGVASCSPKISADRYWIEKKWVVTEMKGVPVQLSGTRRDAFISFNDIEKRFTGNGGCNSISGNYMLDKKQLSFGEVTSTKMSCADIAFENAFLEILKDVDHFEMENDMMLLKDGRKVILKLQSQVLNRF